MFFLGMRLLPPRAGITANLMPQPLPQLPPQLVPQLMPQPLPQPMPQPMRQRVSDWLIGVTPINSLAVD